MAENTVICADCLLEAGMPALADHSVDVVIADPPYEAEAHTQGRRLRGKTVGDYRTINEAPLGFAPITDHERARAARQMARVARRWILVFCQAEAVQKWREELEAAGAKYKRACVWVKPDAQPQLTGDRPGVGYESIVAAHAAAPGRSRWNGGGRVGIYTFNKNSSDPARTGHPTQKPLALMEALVRDFTEPGELILDPYAGSGTTGVAAVRNGRAFVGFERDPAYAEMANKRIRATREQLGLFAAASP